MSRLDGHTILIVHNDAPFVETFVQISDEAGSTSFGAKTLKEAQSLLKTYDFDVVLCHNTLSDGTINDLVTWMLASLSEIPTLIEIGNTTKPRRDEIVEVISEKDHLSTYVKKIHLRLNKEKNQNTNKKESFDSAVFLFDKKIPIKTIQLDPDFIYLTCEEVFPKGTEVLLKISLAEKGKLENFILPAIFEDGESEEKTLQITPTHIPAWNNFLARYEKLQSRMNSFLQKASGL